MTLKALKSYCKVSVDLQYDSQVKIYNMTRVLGPLTTSEEVTMDFAYSMIGIYSQLFSYKDILIVILTE